MVEEVWNLGDVCRVFISLVIDEERGKGKGLAGWEKARQISVVDYVISDKRENMYTKKSCTYYCSLQQILRLKNEKKKKTKKSIMALQPCPYQAFSCPVVVSLTSVRMRDVANAQEWQIIKLMPYFNIVFRCCGGMTPTAPSK